MIVERGYVYEKSNLLYLTLKRAQFSLDWRLPLLSDRNTARELIRDRKCLAIKLLWALMFVFVTYNIVPMPKCYQAHVWKRSYRFPELSESDLNMKTN